MQYRIYESNDLLEVKIQELDDLPFIHVDVFAKWTPSLAKYVKALWVQLKTDLWLEGNDFVFNLDPNEKFMRIFKDKWHRQEIDTPLGKSVMNYVKLEVKEDGI